MKHYWLCWLFRLFFYCLLTRKLIKLLIKKLLIRKSTFYGIVRNKSPGCLYKYILPDDRTYLTRNSNSIKQIFCRSEYYANSFFPYTINEWNKLSLEILTLSHIVYLRNLCSSFQEWFRIVYLVLPIFMG